MPYANPEERRRCQRESYKRRYAASVEMRKKEAERKADWYQQPENKEHRAEMLRAWRRANG